MYAKNIAWDIDLEDGETYQEALYKCDLPAAVWLPDEIVEKEADDEDFISDWLSDMSGFCHAGFELVDDSELPKVTVFLGELFNHLKECELQDDVKTKYGRIVYTEEDSREYYDFHNNIGAVPCMDGETCNILEETDEYVLLDEVDEHIPFYLSKEEFQIATLMDLEAEAEHDLD